MRQIFDFLIFQVLDNSQIFLGLIVLVGLLVQKKKVTEIVDGVVKTIVGLTILGVGADVLSNKLAPIMGLLNTSLGVSGVLPANEAAFGIVMETLATSIVLSFIIGFLIHIILVKISPWEILKNVYLTVHIMLITSSFLHVTFSSMLDIGYWTQVILIAVLLAVYWTLSPAVARKYSKDWTNEDFTLGHAQQMSTWVADTIGRLVGHPEEDAEDLKLPGALSMFKDNTISMAILMPILFIGVGLAIGEAEMVTLSGDTNWIIWLFLSGIEFTAGIVILLSGVRMFIGSIVPAFKGISDKFIPGAIPALDVPVFYSFSPLGAMLGFLGSVAGAFLFFGLSIILKASVIVFPSPIIMFFDGSLIGVFANKKGGWKAALIAGALTSIITHLGFMLLYPMTGTLFGTGLTFSNFDYAVIWLPIIYLIKWIASLFGFLI